VSDAKHDRVYLDPHDPEESLHQLQQVYDLDDAALPMLRRILALYPRPVLLYVDEATALQLADNPLVDHFTFNIQTDELVLFSRDLMTFIDALVEMAMYLAGFATLMGVEDTWMIEFTIGAWKPVRNHIKRRLGIPVEDQPRYIIGLPPAPEDAPLEDPYPFRTLVSQLDVGSFTQMIRLAARDDVEVSFPQGADPRVIEVYVRAKTAMYQVADGLDLDDWREFNRRLLATVQQLDEEYQPHRLPIPLWWQRLQDTQDAEPEPAPADTLIPPDDPADDHSLPPESPTSERWNPFEEFIAGLFDEDENEEHLNS